MATLVLATVMAISPTMASAGGQDSVGRAITQPLRDTRLKNQKIPAVLQLAASAPYSGANTGSCSAILAEVRRLEAALGPDADSARRAKGEGSAVAAVAARTAVNSLIPGLGIVRVITGADKEQRRAEAAVYAGSIRRAYLKGIGRMKRCGTPAAPTAAAIADTPELDRE
ncbi:hypothetical protein [Sphingomonas sp. CARO-RG-8B-R24-01]|uniref:hypothetical protein n=1 Tax=unclassified Sphingomonas TaxID=196159 RepID=UPI001F5A0CF6